MAAEERIQREQVDAVESSNGNGSRGPNEGNGDLAIAEPTWQELFDAARVAGSKTVKAMTFRQRYGTASAPVRVTCDDGYDYVIKGRQAQRMMVNDQIVGRLGAAMAAPVGGVCFVTVTSELIQLNQAEMGHFPEGLAHGSRYMAECDDDRIPLYHDLPANRCRYALMALLYGWTWASDHQYSFERTTKLVHSFDHGHFLGGPNWSGSPLASYGGPIPDPVLVGPCSLTEEEIRAAKASLRNVTRRSIAEAIAAVPDDWGNLTSDERTSLAESLLRRCLTLRN